MEKNSYIKSIITGRWFHRKTSICKVYVTNARLQKLTLLGDDQISISQIPAERSNSTKAEL